MTGPSSGAGPDSVPSSTLAQERPPPVGRLRLWWVVAAGVVAALVLAATDHMLRATVVLSGSLLVGALVRALATAHWTGGLQVRRRHTDVIILLVLAVAVAISGFTLDLTAKV